MARPQTIALALPHPLPPLPKTPPPAPTPLQTLISQTTSNTDYDAVCVPLTNPKWQERWDRLCLRPMDEDEPAPTPQSLAEREAVDREADLWRREGGLNRDELNVTRLEETQTLVATASDWLELDSPDEGIRFDSELVSGVERTLGCIPPISPLEAHLPSLLWRLAPTRRVRMVLAVTEARHSELNCNTRCTSPFPSSSSRPPSLLTGRSSHLTHGPSPTCSP